MNITTTPLLRDPRSFRELGAQPLITTTAFDLATLAAPTAAGPRRPHRQSQSPSLCRVVYTPPTTTPVQLPPILSLTQLDARRTAE